MNTPYDCESWTVDDEIWTVEYVMADEQTFLKSGKTDGGIITFASRLKALQK